MSGSQLALNYGLVPLIVSFVGCFCLLSAFGFNLIYMFPIFLLGIIFSIFVAVVFALVSCILGYIIESLKPFPAPSTPDQNAQRQSSSALQQSNDHSLPSSTSSPQVPSSQPLLPLNSINNAPQPAPANQQQLFFN